MIKVLTGINYTLPRLAGISAECYIASRGESYNTQNISWQGLGYPVKNKLTGEYGLVIDTELRAQWLAYLAEVHVDRLVDVIECDGWNDVVGIVEGE